MKQEVVDIELLTWPEIYKAIHEQARRLCFSLTGARNSGPQGVTGAHNFIAQATADQIARKLGDPWSRPSSLLDQPRQSKSAGNNRHLQQDIRRHQ